MSSDKVMSSYLTHIYRMIQKERSVFWELIVLVIVRKKVCMNMFLIPS